MTKRPKGIYSSAGMMSKDDVTKKRWLLIYKYIRSELLSATCDKNDAPAIQRYVHVYHMLLY